MLHLFCHHYIFFLSCSTQFHCDEATKMNRLDSVRRSKATNNGDNGGEMESLSVFNQTKYSLKGSCKHNRKKNECTWIVIVANSLAGGLIWCVFRICRIWAMKSAIRFHLPHFHTHPRRKQRISRVWERAKEGKKRSLGYYFCGIHAAVISAFA